MSIQPLVNYTALDKGPHVYTLLSGCISAQGTRHVTQSSNYQVPSDGTQSNLAQQTG